MHLLGVVLRRLAARVILLVFVGVWGFATVSMVVSLCPKVIMPMAMLGFLVRVLVSMPIAILVGVAHLGSIFSAIALHVRQSFRRGSLLRS